MKRIKLSARKIIIFWALFTAAAIVAAGILCSGEDRDSGNYLAGGVPRCPAVAKRCLDGSYVGRSGPGCEFDRCPGGLY